MSYRVIKEITPQPPCGIKYMLGDECWLAPEDRTPLRLHCEEWGNLGPMELNAEIKPNAAGFRVRTSQFLAPDGANGFAEIDGKYFWIFSPDEPAAHASGGENKNEHN